jgi:hypothetical protein
VKSTDLFWWRGHCFAPQDPNSRRSRRSSTEAQDVQDELVYFLQEDTERRRDHIVKWYSTCLYDTVFR